MLLGVCKSRLKKISGEMCNGLGVGQGLHAFARANAYGRPRFSKSYKNKVGMKEFNHGCLVALLVLSKWSAGSVWTLPGLCTVFVPAQDGAPIGFVSPAGTCIVQEGRKFESSTMHDSSGCIRV